eukprot:SAG31_NODE_36546_length_312_cov_0.962441_1_plen_79_part_10
MYLIYIQIYTITAIARPYADHPLGSYGCTCMQNAISAVQVASRVLATLRTDRARTVFFLKNTKFNPWTCLHRSNRSTNK